MKPYLCLVATLLISMSVAGSVLDAQAPSRSSTRVGVALSGDGVLGLAHIGVIRYFEEHHIPTDRIAGTSMGGLIGGLYAVGMDSRQMTELVNGYRSI